MKKCKHEYRAFEKLEGETGSNEAFYCIYCLEVVSMVFASYDKVITRPYVTEHITNGKSINEEVREALEKAFDIYRSSSAVDENGKRIFGIPDFHVNVRDLYFRLNGELDELLK